MNFALSCVAIAKEPYIGPVFPDLQLFPNAGAWHSTERAYIVFGGFTSVDSFPNSCL